DGAHWTRVAPHWWFMRPGLWGTWDREHVALAKPIVRDDKILFYYTGHNVPCGSGLSGHLQHDLVHKVVEGQRLGYAIGLATLRLDGFVSLEGYEIGGTVTTRPLVFEGSRLIFNARAPEKPFSGMAGADAQTGRASPPVSSVGPHGTLKIEIQDAAGAPLPGFTAADFDVFSGDRVHQVATWKGRADLGALGGKTVRLKFFLHNAALYSFQFAPERPKPEPMNRLCPGCRGRPRASVAG
ncbi:MAG: hypothetical protein DMG07_27305, partial [Acidobacteria bacterium]